MPKADITKTTKGADDLLKTTKNPLHRKILENYRRHLLFELIGDHAAIFAADMTIPNPQYVLNQYSIRGIDVQSFYKNTYGGTDNNHVIMMEDEKLVVGDAGVGSSSTCAHYVYGSTLLKDGSKYDKDGNPICHNGYYVKRVLTVMFWPYTEDGVLIGEQVAAIGRPEIFALGEDEFITRAEAVQKLTPLIHIHTNGYHHLLSNNAENGNGDQPMMDGK